MRMTSLKICPKCKKPFVDPDDWRKSCILCWKKEKSYDLTKSDLQYQALQDVTHDLNKQIEELQTEIEELEEELEENKNDENSDDNANLTEAQVKALLRLCHPDKHSNSKLSNEVTKWLLAKRDDMKTK